MLRADGLMHINTPLLKSHVLSRDGGANVWLKMDALQPCGSFKMRGMGYKARKEADKGASRFISSSGGNAGLAVAYAGLELGIPVTVYVPTSTEAAMIDNLKLFGAEVVVTGAHWAEAHAAALEEARAEVGAYFHPFDDEDVWQGHATLIDEVVEAGLRPDLVVCSVGGGGLLCGVMTGLRNHQLDSTRVLAVETLGADSLNQSAVRGRHVQLAKMTSRAKSLGAVKVCAAAYAELSNPGLASTVVSDDEAERACGLFLRHHRVKVELACGAALWPVCQAQHEFVVNARNILVVVCGGVSD